MALIMAAYASFARRSFLITLLGCLRKKTHPHLVTCADISQMVIQNLGAFLLLLSSYMGPRVVSRQNIAT